jgi:hypothetical protein
VPFHDGTGVFFAAFPAFRHKTITIQPWATPANIAIDRSVSTQNHPIFGAQSPIGSLPGDTHGFDISTTGETLYRFFKNNPDLPGIILTRQKIRVSAISQKAFYQVISRPFGIEIFFRRPVATLIEVSGVEMLSLPATLSLQEAVERCTSRRRSDIYEPFLVVDQATGEEKIVDFRTLLLASGSVFDRNRQMDQMLASVVEGTSALGQSIEAIAKNSNKAVLIAGDAVSVTTVAQETIGRLKDSSHEIGKVLGLIKGFTRQTHFLGLNASLEAGRAGKEGIGFGIIARELRALSGETVQAAEEIRAKIEGIQNGAQSVVAAMERISEIIHSINNLQIANARAVETQTKATHDMNRKVRDSAQTWNNAEPRATDAPHTAQAPCFTPPPATYRRATAPSPGRRRSR